MAGTVKGSGAVCSPPALKYLYTVRASVAAPLEIGNGPYGRRRCIPVTEGTVEGDRIQGKILPGGADYMLVEDDGTIHADTRYTIETNDGAYIYSQTTGVRSGEPAALKALISGHEANPSDYWFHIAVKLESGHEKYRWLNNRIIVARATRVGGQIAYDAYVLENS